MTSKLWILLGPELGRKEKQIQKLKTEFWGKDGPQKDKNSSDKNETEFVCGFDTVEQIANFIETPSLFDRQQLVFLMQVEELNATETKRLSETIKKSKDYTTIVLVSSETRLSSSLDLAARAQKIVFWKLSESECYDHLVGLTRKKGIQMSSQAVDMMLLMIGHNYSELEFTVNQIHSYVTQHKIHNVGVEEIENWLSHYKQETVFSLFLEISRRNYTIVFDDMKLLLNAGEHPIRIMAGLFYQFNMAFQILREMQKGGSFYSACLAFNVKAKGIQSQYSQFLKHVDMQGMENIFRLCVDTDSYIRSNRATLSADIYMSLFVYNLYQIHVLKRSSFTPF